MPKKDFAGKNKTKNTYDKDWVLTKVRQKGGKFAYAWVTQRQNKKIMGDEDAGRRARNARNEAGGGAAVPTPTTPTTAPIDVTGIGGQPGTTVVPTPTGGGGQVPGWWIGTTYTNPNEQQMFASAANALLPTLAPEDQRTLGNYLATNFKDVYGAYANAQFDPIPTDITGAEQQKYLSTDRANMALSLLDRMKAASGSQTMGAGYDFLKNAVNLINQYSGPDGGQLTREQYTQFTTALNNIMTQAGKDLSAYSNLATLFNTPSFSAGPLVSNTPNANLYS